MSDRISEHISLKEGIKSHTATRLNIDNIPRELDLVNMKTIAEQVFEPLRKFVGVVVVLVVVFVVINVVVVVDGIV